MEQIREGLETDIDVSIYSNPSIDWKEMERMRLELEEYDWN